MHWYDFGINPFEPYVYYDYEPDFDDYFLELESLEINMANVGSYDDWFVEEKK